MKVISATGRLCIYGIAVKASHRFVLSVIPAKAETQRARPYRANRVIPCAGLTVVCRLLPNSGGRRGKWWLKQFALGRKRLLDTLLAAVYQSAGIHFVLTANPADF